MANIDLVISIPEEYYKNLLENCRFSSEEIPIISLAIATGALLPKGHGNLKDVSKLPYHCMYENNASCDHKNCNVCQFMCVAKYEMDDILTIIEADNA